MRAGIKSILLILACAVLFGAGFRPRPLPAAAYAATGYSFAGALRAWKESLGPPLPEAVLLDVPVVYQWPEMPNGCEATALTMLLQYYGFAADKLSVAYDYIPRSDFTYTWFSTYGPDPASAYAGDPALFGFYCLAPAVAEGANRYLAEQDSTLRAVDISGADGYVLRRSIAQGRPVVVWATIGFEPLVYSDYSWRLYSEAPSTIPTKTCTVLWYAATTRTIFISAIRYTARCRSNAAPSCCATRKWNAVQSCSAKRRRMRPLCIREVQGSRKPHCKNKKRKASGCFDGTPPKQPDA